MKVKTAELSGRALDWSVGKALGIDVISSGGEVWKYFSEDELHAGEDEGIYEYRPSFDWSQCGKLIEAEGIEFKWVSDATLEAHSYLHDPHYGYGLTHQEAACRLIVASKLGDEVDIPDELMESEQ